MVAFNIEEYYKEMVEKESSSAIASIKTLEKFVVEDDSKTSLEFQKNFRIIFEKLKNIDPKLEVESIGEIYFRFITLKCGEIDFLNFDAFKQEALRQGQIYFEKVLNSRTKLAKHAQKFIADGCKILVHSYSGAVLESLKAARKMNKHFEVFVTESAPDRSGNRMVDSLRAEGITATLILDAAIAYIMPRVRIVLVGAEGVVESGGIINKIGTYSVGICAKALNKPMYVCAESYKFVRYYPLSQAEIPPRLKWRNEQQDTAEQHPLVDYTPPEYITLLHTDLGTLTTAAVLDTLLQLYT